MQQEDFMERLTLRKGEKLRHRSLVNPLFKGANSLYAYPLRIVWRTLSEEQLAETFCGHVPSAIGSLQMMITVPKKKRRHAVDRVTMRRRIREAYRLNRLPLKHKLEDSAEARTLSMSIIYIADKNEPSALVHARMRKLLARIEAEISAPLSPAADSGAESAAGESPSISHA
ncbi:MAG: hypothetical protein HDS85_06120 [Bacteroidales bacterium]|nr:hypothetical protein [Bacteroidales bacterium]